ncbi:MAG: hypothetical protein JW827_03535 [Spirochaetes bacterium]|nr:hypothetical protein [Spirochaetota bacterium]
MRFQSRSIIYMIGSVLMMLIFIQSTCDLDKPLVPQLQPKNPFLDGVTTIDIEYTFSAQSGGDILYKSADYFIYEPPEQASLLMLGVFSGPIQVSADNEIGTANLIAGHRSGLTGFSRTTMYVKDLLTFSQTTKDFTTTTYSSTGTNAYKVAVWGYDKNGYLTHASPAIDIKIAWTK